jgi:hypothetical protein
MTRLGAVFWGGLVLASGFATFNVKYAVQGIDDELVRVRRQTVAEQQEIRVLTAEWAYLNQPDRLAELNRSLLQLAPVTAKQMQGRVDAIALRAPPAGDPATTTGATSLAADNSRAAMPAVAASVPPPAAVSARAEGGVVAENRTAEPKAGANSATGNGIEGQTADAASRAIPAADATSDAGAALAEALRVLGIEAGGQTPRVQVAKASPASLDALIAKIADTR